MNIFEIIEKYFPDLKSGDVLPSHGQSFRSILYESHRKEYQAILETAPAFGDLIGDYVEGNGSQILQVIAHHFTDHLQDNIELLEIEKEPTLDHTAKLIIKAPKTYQFRSLLGCYRGTKPYNG